jgi:hypothetical protein
MLMSVTSSLVLFFTSFSLSLKNFTQTHRWYCV